MNRPFKTYNGGKNGSGVYQAIINQIPPHEIFISGFAGNCGVLANKRPASMANIAIDMDAAVTQGWQVQPGVTAINSDAITYIGQFLDTVPKSLLKQIFIFLDPPYLMEVRTGKKKYYRHEMTDLATHIKLVRAMVSWPVNILLTHYPCDLYNKLLERPGNQWRHIDIQAMTRKGLRTERLYMNYPPPEQLHDYRYFGNDYREREEYKKMHRNFTNKLNRLTPLERNFLLHNIKPTP